MVDKPKNSGRAEFSGVIGISRVQSPLAELGEGHTDQNEPEDSSAEGADSSGQDTAATGDGSTQSGLHATGPGQQQMKGLLEPGKAQVKVARRGRKKRRGHKDNRQGQQLDSDGAVIDTRRRDKRRSGAKFATATSLPSLPITGVKKGGLGPKLHQADTKDSTKSGGGTDSHLKDILPLLQRLADKETNTKTTPSTPLGSSPPLLLGEPSDSPQSRRYKIVEGLLFKTA